MLQKNFDIKCLHTKLSSFHFMWSFLVLKFTLFLLISFLCHYFCFHFLNLSFLCHHFCYPFYLFFIFVSITPLFFSWKCDEGSQIFTSWWANCHGNHADTCIMMHTSELLPLSQGCLDNIHCINIPTISFMHVSARLRTAAEDNSRLWTAEFWIIQSVDASLNPDGTDHHW
jgi:hypothetical protein